MRGLSKGGIRNSIFTLFASTVGAGVLLLPKIIAQFGFVIGIGVLISFGLLAHLCQRILMGLIIKSGKLSYANVVSFYLGKNFGKFMV